MRELNATFPFTGLLRHSFSNDVLRLLDGLYVRAYISNSSEREKIIKKKTLDGWSPFKIVCPADGAVTGAAVYFVFGREREGGGSCTVYVIHNRRNTKRQGVIIL